MGDQSTCIQKRERSESCCCQKGRHVNLRPGTRSLPVLDKLLEHKLLTKASFCAHIIVHLMMHPCLTMLSDVSTEIGRPSCEDRVFLTEIAHMSLRR
jgi:hypothetical protein